MKIIYQQKTKSKLTRLIEHTNRADKSQMLHVAAYGQTYKLRAFPCFLWNILILKYMYAQRQFIGESSPIFPQSLSTL